MFVVYPSNPHCESAAAQSRFDEKELGTNQMTHQLVIPGKQTCSCLLSSCTSQNQRRNLSVCWFCILCQEPCCPEPEPTWNNEDAQCVQTALDLFQTGPETREMNLGLFNQQLSENRCPTVSTGNKHLPEVCFHSTGV